VTIHKTLLGLTAGFLICTGIRTVGAEETAAFDPAAAAKTVAPFIQEDTYLIARVDLAQIRLGALADQLAAEEPRIKNAVFRYRDRVQDLCDTLRAAGVHEFYWLFSLRPLSEHHSGMAVIPGGSAIDEQALRRIPQLSGFAFRRSGDVLLAAQRPAFLEDAIPETPDPRPDLETAFAAAGDGAVQLVLILPKYTARVVDELGYNPPAGFNLGWGTVAIQSIRWLAFGLELSPRPSGKLILQSDNALVAPLREMILLEVLRMGGKFLYPSELVGLYDKGQKLLSRRTQGNCLIWEFPDNKENEKKILALVSQGIYDACEKQMKEDLQHIGWAVWGSTDNHDQRFPSAAGYSPQGKPLLSWRVHLLPYFNKEKTTELYLQFHLDEPWDSPHNRTLIDKMPDIYRSPLAGFREKGKTTYLLPVGPGTVFEGREGMPRSKIEKQLKQVVVLVNADADKGVIWTKPEDLPFDPQNPSRGLGGPEGKGFFAVFANSRVEWIPLPQNPEKLRLMFQATAEEPKPDR
jgi:hypothetical protein